MKTSGSAAYAVGLLFVINLLNYLDRQILYSLLPLIKSEMSLSDARLGSLASAFMVVYMVAAVPVGYLADRSSRKNWIAVGLAFWSLATLASGVTRGFWQLFSTRAAVGIGESCYGSVSPPFVAEHFPKERRGGALAFFSMAIPVGSALGYILGGAIGHAYGWRAAFFVVGLPGLLLSALAYRLEDPRGPDAGAAARTPSLADYARLRSIPSYAASTLAMAAMTFSLGGLAVWMPTFFTRFWGMNVLQAGTLFGGITVAAGLLGSLLGGWLGDRLLAYTGKAYFLVSGVGLALAVPAGCAAVLSHSRPLTLAALFLAETLAFLNMGPLNAVIVWVVSAPMRSLAFAANIFVIHALGDALSPALIGRMSDQWGLRAALVAAMGMLGVAAGFCLWGAGHIEADSREAALV